MLKREFRLRSPRDFKRLYGKGGIAHAEHFSVKYAPNQTGGTRVAVVVNTKISKKAVVRNRIRRRLYAQLSELWPELKAGYDLAVLVRGDISKAPLEDIKGQLLSCLKRAGILNHANY